ncbi:MAG: hypothetical protein RLZZ519_1188 [Bacteroidota bacterium]
MIVRWVDAVASSGAMCACVVFSFSDFESALQPKTSVGNVGYMHQQMFYYKPKFATFRL